MATRWNEWVIDWAEERGITYGCALTKKQCSIDYHKEYPKPIGKRELKRREKAEAEKKAKQLEAKRAYNRDRSKRVYAEKREAKAMAKEDKPVEGSGILENIRMRLTEVGEKGRKLAKQTKKAVALGANEAIGMANQAVDAVGKYARVVAYGRKDYPPKVREILAKYGDDVITSFTLKRTPVEKVLTGVLSAVSGGEFGKRLANAPFDDVFHLFLEMKTAGGKRIAFEKNEVINAELDPPKRDKEESRTISPAPSDIPLSTLLDNAKRMMGKRYFTYSAKDNNCQDFIVAILKSNGIGTEEDIKWVKQDNKELFRDLPYLRKFANTLTDLGAKVNEITQGAGVSDTDLKSSSKKKVSTNTIQKMPKFAKGSQEAKDFMASIRGRKKGGSVAIHPPSENPFQGPRPRPPYDEADNAGTMEGSGVRCPHCETTMRGGKIDIGKAFRDFGKKIIGKKATKSIEKFGKDAGKYITSKKGGLATDLIDYGVPAATAAILGGVGGLAGGPLGGVAGSAAGSKLGKEIIAKELHKATGAGVRKGRFVKGSQEAKDYMRMLREKRMK